MQIGIVGLGRMGANIGRRLMSKGHKVVGYDRDPKAVGAMAGAEAAGDLKDLVSKLAAPRTVWVMLPAGKITEEAVSELGQLLSPGDAVIDGGNTFYKDDIRRAKNLKAKNIAYLDCGTSGGVWGMERGYCMMIGGDKRRWTGWTRFFPPWRPAPAPSKKPRAAKAAIRASPMAICIAARPVRGISSR